MTGRRAKSRARETRQLDLFRCVDERPAEGGTIGADTADRKRASPAWLPAADPVAVLGYGTLAQRVAAIGRLAEAGPAEAVPELVAVCRRYIGFDPSTANTEQLAAITALGRLGTRDAANGLLGLFRHRAFGACSALVALTAARALKMTLPDDILTPFLRADDPDVRAQACRLAGDGLPVLGIMHDLLSDLHPHVRIAAATGLGRARRSDGAETLRQVAEQDALDLDIVDAIATLAESDRDFVVLLRRLARREDATGDHARASLEDIEPRFVGLPLAPTPVPGHWPDQRREPSLVSGDLR